MHAPNLAAALLSACIVVLPAIAQTPAPETDAAPPVTETAPQVPLQVPQQAPPAADATAAPPVQQRYSLNRVDGGFLRLDGTTGQLAFCTPRAMGWTCQAVPEDRAALETEIARLQGEVTKLQGEIAALREPPPPRPPAELTPPKPGEPKVKLPSSEDLDRARAIIEDAWRRIVDMIDAMRRDVMRKG